MVYKYNFYMNHIKSHLVFGLLGGIKTLPIFCFEEKYFSLIYYHFLEYWDSTGVDNSWRVHELFQVTNNIFVILFVSSDEMLVVMGFKS